MLKKRIYGKADPHQLQLYQSLLPLATEYFTGLKNAGQNLPVRRTFRFSNAYNGTMLLTKGDSSMAPYMPSNVSDYVETHMMQYKPKYEEGSF